MKKLVIANVLRFLYFRNEYISIFIFLGIGKCKRSCCCGGLNFDIQESRLRNRNDGILSHGYWCYSVQWSQKEEQIELFLSYCLYHSIKQSIFGYRRFTTTMLLIPYVTLPVTFSGNQKKEYSDCCFRKIWIQQGRKIGSMHIWLPISMTFRWWSFYRLLFFTKLNQVKLIFVGPFSNFFQTCTLLYDHKDIMILLYKFYS